MKTTRIIQPATALILARSGSKGVPGKNTALVGGKPCIAWTILDAQSSSLVNRVVVTTDSQAAARVARDLGCDVIERPPELATDSATVDASARHAVRELGLADQPFESRPPIVLLYANVPVRPPDLIDRAVARLASSFADSVQSYAAVGKHHPWWTCRVDANDGTVAPWEGDTLFHNVFRRQELPPAFVPDGGVMAVTMESLMLEIAGVKPGPHAFLGRDQRRCGVTTHEGDVVDIDSPIDLIVADAILTGAPSSDGARRLPHASPTRTLSCS